MGVRSGHRQQYQRLQQWLLTMAAMFVTVAAANAQPCPSDSPNAAQLACRRATSNIALDVHHLSLAAASLVTGRRTHMEMDLRADDRRASPTTGQQLDVPWKNVVGPAWVGNVPDWVTDTARNYRHRGLPLVDLWQSSHYMVALGLSNHGVPGLYFSQKLP